MICVYINIKHLKDDVERCASKFSDNCKRKEKIRFLNARIMFASNIDNDDDKHLFSAWILKDLSYTKSK